MSGYQVGEIVDIEIKGARIARTHASQPGVLFIYYPGALHQVPIAPAGNVTITRVGPAEWPPVAGDLWRDRDGGLWFAADVHDVEETDQPEIVLVWAYENYRQKPDLVNQRSGPLTLVHREEPAAPPAETGVTPADIEQGVNYLDQKGWAWTWRGESALDDCPLMVSALRPGLVRADTLIRETGPLRKEPNSVDFAEVTYGGEPA